jgi:putative transcriptional regulator
MPLFYRSTVIEAYSLCVTAPQAHQLTLTLHDHVVEPLRLPRLDGRALREVRTRLGMSRAVFALKLGLQERTLERWEQGRSRPPAEACALILLVRHFPDTLTRLEALAQGARRPRARRRP